VVVVVVSAADPPSVGSAVLLLMLRPNRADADVVTRNTLPMGKAATQVKCKRTTRPGVVLLWLLLLLLLLV
jgi:hypothetical protein